MAGPSMLTSIGALFARPRSFSPAPRWTLGMKFEIVTLSAKLYPANRFGSGVLASAPIISALWASSFCIFVLVMIISLINSPLNCLAEPSKVIYGSQINNK